MDKVMKDKKAILVFTLPALLLFCAIIVVPIVFSSYYSLLDWNGVGGSGSKVFVGLGNYARLFTNPLDYFMLGVKNSAILALLSMFVQVPLALVLALVIARNIKGESFFRNIYFIPVVISTTVIGQLWMKIYHPNNGLLNFALERLGLEGLKRNWLADPGLALAAAFFVLVWQYIGYHMLLLYSSIKSIPPQLNEAAEIDGASPSQVARYVTLPLIMPMIKVCVTFALIGSLKTFDLIYVLTKGGPVHATEVPTTLMFSTIFLHNKYGYGSAMAIFILLECLVFTVFLQKVFKTESYEY